MHEINTTTTIIVTLIVWIALGVITANLAKQRGRDPFIWFFIGTVFGLLGMLLLFILPNLSSEEVKKTEKTDDNVVLPVIVEELPLEPSQLFQLKDWFCIDSTTKGQLGPMSFDALKGLWKKEKVVPGTYVWSEGMSEWQPVENVKNLEEALMK